eukprot:1148644-Pyramimonas_sp.AAC.1
MGSEDRAASAICRRCGAILRPHPLGSRLGGPETLVLLLAASPGGRERRAGRLLLEASPPACWQVC